MVHALYPFHRRLSTRDGGEGGHPIQPNDLRCWYASEVQISGALVGNQRLGLSRQLQAALNPLQPLIKAV